MAEGERIPPSRVFAPRRSSRIMFSFICLPVLLPGRHARSRYTALCRPRPQTPSPPFLSRCRPPEPRFSFVYGLALYITSCFLGGFGSLQTLFVSLVSRRSTPFELFSGPHCRRILWSRSQLGFLKPCRPYSSRLLVRHGPLFLIVFFFPSFLLGWMRFTVLPDEERPSAISIVID